MIRIRKILESINEIATPLKGHPYHYKSNDELQYICKDAGEARDNMHAMGNTEKENKYADQINDACTILNYRKQGGKQLSKAKKDDQSQKNTQ